jgi:hypothetical protein
MPISGFQAPSQGNGKTQAATGADQLERAFNLYDHLLFL